METFRWREVAEVVGVAAIVASLIFVGLQLQQDEEIAIVETRGSITASKMNLAEIVKGNGSIWRKGLDGEDLTEAEHIEFLAMFEAVESHYFTMFIRWGRLNVIDPEEAAREFAYAVFTHPGLQQARVAKTEYLRVQNQILGANDDLSPFDSSVETYLRDLNSGSLPVEPQKSYVFW